MNNKNLFIEWLKKMTDEKGSDIYLNPGAYPYLRGDNFEPLSENKLTENDLNRIVSELLLPDQHATFARTKEFNMSLNIGRGGRFRINIMQQMGVPTIVARRIAQDIPTLDDLHLPHLLGELCCEPRGLILVVGATGSGKSTSLAAMMDYRNRTKEGHILTVEDPIEYVHQHKKCIISQREVGTDTESFDIALKNALRQHPDLILVGEIRDKSTMQHALNISETGHLALATLHANNANQAIERVLTFYSQEEKRQTLLTLSFNLRCIMSQRLVRKQTGGRRAVNEIMLADKEILNMIANGETKSLKEAIARKNDLGMITFDQSLINLYKEGIISKEVALGESDDRFEMKDIIENIENKKEED